jgi:phospholipid/cholesterol/gamma-HCH transport system permease protein
MRSGLHPVSALERGGGFLLDMLREAAFIVAFAYAALAAALTPSIYRVATRQVTMRQVYFTACDVLPWFLLASTLLSLVLVEIVVAAARAQGLSYLALEMTLRVLPLEVVPFVTALFVALRSGSAINTEVALMHVRGEIDAIERDGGDAMRDEFIPRIVACAFSVVALTVVSSAISIVLAYLALYGFTTEGYEQFNEVVGRLFGLPVFAGLVAKCALFGIVVAVVPIASGLSVPRAQRFVPVAVMKGMVRLFFLLTLVETVALAAKYV